ncbi:peptidylprolyl isomerase [Entomospira entomophila]|uniref:peptidylprolyl isomerase n=1 Tax=Entomospira entomophila TaxID=2719988 RepID=A0A968KSK4_9SPIO|nr:peptidylprolyl isomerase [Entomospira entomophilus]NIZ40442.1 peptidylprolyl isomerase [Entomospira entomophilus]WDI36000.1 peptidylprolyl isomerase [Entomospira entomophilus]
MSCTQGAKASQDGSYNSKERQMERQAREEALTDGIYANIQTNRGDIWVRLFYDQTPLTVLNFIGLAEGTLNANRQGAFYDGVTFHRVIKNFMIQGGDPEGTGAGDPGYRFPDEIVEALVFDRAGLLAMANAGPGTNGSQFFITHEPTPHLNGKHTIFGEVVSSEDQDVVNAIEQNDTIMHVTILRKGASAESFVANQEEFDRLLTELKGAEALKLRQYQEAMHAIVKQVMPNAQKSPKGVFFTIEKQGTGEKPKQGSKVDIHYEGRLLVTDALFDSSYARNEPLAIPAGVGQVIEGWDEMVMDMKVGEKRTVILPPELGYGAMGYPGVIPANAWLKFTMERVS